MSESIRYSSANWFGAHFFGYSSISKTAPVNWVNGSPPSAPLSSSVSINSTVSSSTTDTNSSISTTTPVSSSSIVSSRRGYSSGVLSGTNSYRGSTSSPITSSSSIVSSSGNSWIGGYSSASIIGYSSLYQGSGWFGYSSIGGSSTSSSINFTGSSSISNSVGGHSSISTTNSGSSSSKSINENNYILNNWNNSSLFISPPNQYKQPILSKASPQMQAWQNMGLIMPAHDIISSILQQYGYNLTSQELQEIDNLQSGQSVIIQGATPVKITYLGNNQYQIQTVGNPFTPSGQEVGLNLVVTIPTYSINQQTGQIGTGSIIISGTITNNMAITFSNGFTEIFPYQTETYSVNEIIPIISTISGNQVTFQTGTPQGSVTLQSISLPTITTQQLQELQSGQNIGLKPGLYYNPQTQQIIQVSYQTVQQPQINWNQLWFSYSSATPQTVQNLPQNTYLFLNPVGYSSTNPNIVYSIGVNFDTNTVYLINSYGQIISTKTFNNIQSMLDYLQNNWDLNLNPTPQPGQPVLSTAVNFNNLNPNLQLQSIILQNDQLINNAVTSLTNNPLTFLQDIATITTAGFSTALADMGLKSQALSVQNFAQQIYYNPTLGDIVGGAEVGGLILLGFFAPEALINFGIGAITGVGIGEALSLATGQGPLSSSQVVAQAELGGLFSMVGGIAGGYLSAAFSKGAGALTTMITGSEEWGSKIAGLIPLWRFAGSEVTNLALSYPFFRNNQKEWLEWSTLFSLGDVFIPGIMGSILSKWDVWRGKSVIAEKGPIKLSLEDEPIEGYIAKLPDNTVLNIVPRSTAGEGIELQFIQRYVYKVGKNNLLSHVTPSMTFINDLAKGKEVEIVPTSNPNAWDWRIAAGNTGLYLSPGESPNEAVALGFYGGITDIYPSLEYPRFTRMSWREALYRFLHPFDRAGIILINKDTAVGPLPPQELLDYIDYLKTKYKGNLDKVVDELLKNPKYGPMYMRWKNAVKEFSATTGTPVVGSEDITNMRHERQFVIEPGAKLKGTGITYNVWIRQTPELLENLPSPLQDILSDWFKVRVTRAKVIPGKPTDLFVINNIKIQNSAISTGKESESYYEREIRPYRTLSYTEYAKAPLYNIYRTENRENIENTERMRYSGYTRENRYIEAIREAGTYEYNRNKYRENYNNREYRITLEEYPYRENYREYRINEHPYRIPYERPIGYYNYYYEYPYPPKEPPYQPRSNKEEQSPKTRNPPGIPPFMFPEITIMGQPIRGLGFGLGRGVRIMYDIQYALSRLGW